MKRLSVRPMDSRSSAGGATRWTPRTCACTAAGEGLRNTTHIFCAPSRLCSNYYGPSSNAGWPGWPQRACLFTSLHVAPTGLRPFHQTPTLQLRHQWRKFKPLLDSLSRAHTTPRMYTLVRAENESILWGMNTTGVVLRTQHPAWANQWHMQSFAKLAIPRAARRVKCERVLFLDNDVRALRNVDHIFTLAEPPAFVWHRGSGGKRLNSGVMLLPTDAAFVEALEAYTARLYANRSTPRRLREGGDQEVWQGFFAESGRRVTELPAAYNARKTMRLNLSQILLAHLIYGDDDGDPLLKRARFIPHEGLLDQPLPPD